MKQLIALLATASALGVGLYATLKKPGSVTSMSGYRRRRRGGLRGPHEERELLLYCENDGDIYRQQISMIEKNLDKKLAKGVYDHEKAKKLWGYAADNCAKKYVKEFGSENGLPWHKMFSTADRRAVAKAFADDWLSNKQGSWTPKLHALPRAA